MLVLAAAFLVAFAALAGDGATPCDRARAAAEIPAAEGEASLTVHGAVYESDGDTPASGVIVYAYQTGPDGRYGVDDAGGPMRRAWMKTDASGRFVLTTSMPGPYPGGGEAAHIHVQFWGEEAPIQWAPTVYFSGDPLLAQMDEARLTRDGRFRNVVEIETDGAGRVIRPAFKLKAKGDRLQQSIRHGVEACAR